MSCSGWTRSYSDALPGIFKRSQAYDELRDDARDDFQKASGGNGSNTPLPDEPKGSMGLKQKKVPVDKAFSQINLGDRQNSAGELCNAPCKDIHNSICGFDSPPSEAHCNVLAVFKPC